MRSNLHFIRLATLHAILSGFTGCGQAADPLVGVWQGEGTAGIRAGTKAAVELTLKADKTFFLECLAFEPQHTLNAHPTQDHITAEGTWTFDKDNGLILNAKITEFVRAIRTGTINIQGHPITEKTTLKPRPMERPITMGVRQQGILFLGLATFEAEGLLPSSPISRMIHGVTFERAKVSPAP